MSDPNAYLWHNLVSQYESQKEKLIWQINLFLLISTSLVAIFYNVIFPEDEHSSLVWLIVSYLPLFFIVFYFLRRGRVRAASIAQISILWALVTTITFMLGVNSPSMYSYVFITTLAGLLLSHRAVIWTALGGLVASTTILLLQLNTMVLVQPLTDLPPFGAWLGSTIHLIIITTVIYLTIQRVDAIRIELANQQQRLQENSTELQLASARLQEAHEQQLETKSQLSIIEQRYRSLFETAPIMYVIVSEATGKPVIEDCNELFLQNLGYTHEEVIGQQLENFYTAESRMALEHSLNGQDTKEVPDIVEERRTLLAKDGRTIPTLFRLMYAKHDEGAAFQLAQAMYVDISMYEQARQQAETYAHQLETMYQTNVALSQTLEVEVILKNLLQSLKLLVPYDSAHVMIVDPSYNTNSELGLTEHKAWTSPDRGHIQFYQPDSNPILQRIHQQKHTIIVPDTLKEPAWERIPGSEHIRNWMGVPLIVKNDLIGLFGTNKNEPAVFTNEHARLAESLAAQAAVSIANAILFQQVKTHAGELESKVNQRTADLTAANGQLRSEISERTRAETALRTRNNQLAILRQVGLQLAAQLEPDQLLNIVIEQAINLLKAEAGHLSLLREDKEQEYLEISFSSGKTQISNGTKMTDPQGLIGHVWQHQQSHYINNYREWQNKGLTQPFYSSVIGAPVMWHDQMIGVLTIMSTEEGFFSDDSAELLSLFAAQAAVAIKNARLHEEVQQNAQHLEKVVRQRTHELTEANEQLLQLDSLRAKLIQDISHELRTPITNISLYLELLERKPDRLERYLGTLHQQMERLKQLVQDIVQISYLHSRRKQVNLNWINLNSYIHEIINIHRARAEEKGLQLTLKQDEQLPQMYADGKQLQDLVNILLVNALSYTVEGSVQVCTSYDHSNDTIQITVSDTGRGITAEDLPHIFSPLYRGEGASQSNIPGIGLGLTTAAEIARIHQGQIEVSRTTQGEGATFIVSLPRQVVNELLITEG